MVREIKLVHQRGCTKDTSMVTRGQLPVYKHREQRRLGKGSSRFLKYEILISS